MDAGTAAVLGALAGGAVTVIVTMVNNLYQRGEAKAQRTFDKSENDASRSHDRTAALLAHRQERIERWRQGMEAAHAEYQSFIRYISDTPPDRRAPGGDWEPNIVGTEWFESLRPYLASSAGLEGYLRADSVPCEPPLVLSLSREIGRLEREWEAESGR